MPRISEPKKTEPIRLVQTKSGARYRVTLDIAPAGAPRKQITKTFKALPEARRFVSETRDRLARGTFTAPSNITLAELAEEWLASRRDIRAKSVRGYRDVLSPVLRQLGRRKVQSILRRDVDALVDHLCQHGGRSGNGYSHRSIVYSLGALKQVLNYGVSIGVLHANPAAGVKPPRRRKGDRRKVTPWEPEEVLRFRDKSDADPLAAAWRLTLCGLRRSEVLGLSWDDVDLDLGTVHIGWSRVLVGKGQTERDDTKSPASDRTICPDDVHPGTMALLRSLKARQAADRLRVGPAYGLTMQSGLSANLVVVDELGLPLNPATYSDRFSALCRAAGVPAIGIHTIRHTVARIMHEAGVSPADAAAFLGHTLAVHLSVYVVLTQRGAQAAGQALGGALTAVVGGA